MTKHMEKEVDKLKQRILGLSSLVEDAVYKAVKAVNERDYARAQQVIDRDYEIDALEVEVEEECLKILALHQPVAIDLRFIIAVLKMNNDLERIGDLAVNISRRAQSLTKFPRLKRALDFEPMSDKVMSMLRKSLEALINLDSKLAHSVCEADDEVDKLNREMLTAISEGVRTHPEDGEILLHLISVSKNLERIADHSTNIAEDVIYMIEGEIVRHRAGAKAEKQARVLSYAAKRTAGGNGLGN